MSDNPELTHLEASYQNGQEIIRAMDTKANIFLAFEIAIIVGTISGWKWVFENKGYLTPFSENTPMDLLTIFVAIVVLIFGFVSLLFFVLALIARGPKNATPTILFPFNPSNKSYSDLISSASAIDDKKRIFEYKEQLKILGTIIRKKISWCRKASIALICQIGVVIVLLLLAVLNQLFILSCN